MTASLFGVNSYPFTLSRTAEAFMRQLADRGYRSFELMMYPGHLWPGRTDCRALARLVQQQRLRIVTLNMPNLDINISAASEEMRSLSLSMCMRLVRLAGEVGARGVVMGPGKANPLLPAPRHELIGHMRRALEQLAPMAESAGTALYIENLPFGFLPDAAGLMDALDSHGDERIGICYDVANGHFIGEAPCEGLRHVRRRLKLVHVSDTPRTVYRHAAIGSGDVPFERIPPVLAEVGYGEVPVIEIISDDPEATIDDSVRRLTELGWQPDSSLR